MKKNKYHWHLVGGAIALLLSLLLASALQGQVIRDPTRARLQPKLSLPILEKNDRWFIPALGGSFLAGALGGRAEYIRYHQHEFQPGTYYYMDPGGEYETTWNDGFHAYRDAGLVTLGASTICLTLSFKQDKWWEIPLKVGLFSAAYLGGTKIGYR